ncbi:CRISPR-associated protein Cas4 [Natronorubrum daqingense]|uniref:CRISPR-associated exonuclease Cas4 n=1 Tax=Natronorubrum daqingense TaxID=588898 RepID=A0A1N7FAM4_9EURY|nr:hypothetical protein [Natronorubrum daqingense]APX97654.1 hypothetical protein BB347_14115 [Natronorubrum daqingense]SIR97401.1 CRISPR-associated exonuclease Cas4 [Natronorubrum daqingense]
MTRALVSLSDLRTAAYCPRKCYYRQTSDDDGEPPPVVDSIRTLATRYPELLSAPAGALEAEPIAVTPIQYRERLGATRDRLEGRGHWDRLTAASVQHVYVAGRDCHGIVHKVLEDPLEPVLISTGSPPEQGVWDSQSVHAVGAAKALSWEHDQRVEHAWLEYPAHGVIRRIKLSTRRKARYRRVLRSVRELDGPPARTTNRSKCSACEFATKCGVRTRTLRSLLGF